MKNNNGLIDVIEELLEADMTAPKKVRNPQAQQWVAQQMKARGITKKPKGFEINC